MGFNRKEGKPPLYRKVNKRTHNGWSWYQFSHNRYRYERGKKQDVLPERLPIKRCDSTFRTGYDYTPLIKFLHAHVGQPWDEVYQECVSRLDSPEPITWMVVNINERGLVVNRNPNGEMSAWCCVGGEESYWSALWVDDDGLLQFVNPDYSWIEANRDHVDEFYSGEWTISWNGKVVWPESAVKPENGV